MMTFRASLCHEWHRWFPVGTGILAGLLYAIVSQTVGLWLLVLTLGIMTGQFLDDLAQKRMWPHRDPEDPR